MQSEAVGWRLFDLFDFAAPSGFVRRWRLLLASASCFWPPLSFSLFAFRFSLFALGSSLFAFRLSLCLRQVRPSQQLTPLGRQRTFAMRALQEHLSTGPVLLGGNIRPPSTGPTCSPTGAAYLSSSLLGQFCSPANFAKSQRTCSNQLGPICNPKAPSAVPTHRPSLLLKCTLAGSHSSTWPPLGRLSAAE